jgi:hypothetical protein
VCSMMDWNQISLWDIDTINERIDQVFHGLGEIYINRSNKSLTEYTKLSKVYKSFLRRANKSLTSSQYYLLPYKEKKWKIKWVFLIITNVFESNQNIEHNSQESIND